MYFLCVSSCRSGAPLFFRRAREKIEVLEVIKIRENWEKLGKTGKTRKFSKISDCTLAGESSQKSAIVDLLANRIEGYKTRRRRRCRGGQAITQGVSKNSVQTNGSSKKMCATDKKSS